MDGVRIVTRAEWGAEPPHPPDLLPDNYNVLEHPVPYVIISHTAGTFCYTQETCIRVVRAVQYFHMETRCFDDIGYNFLVGGDGLVYEGRGWDTRGVHAKTHNSKSIGISFIGDFRTDLPTRAQVFAAKALIQRGLNEGKIARDYKLLGHRQCSPTESPGELLYNIIKTWDHWSPIAVDLR